MSSKPIYQDLKEFVEIVSATGNSNEKVLSEMILRLCSAMEKVYEKLELHSGHTLVPDKKNQ